MHTSRVSQKKHWIAGLKPNAGVTSTDETTPIKNSGPKVAKNGQRRKLKY